MDTSSDPQTHSEIKVSIIIPNLHSPIIDRTIESILAQKTRHTYQIIVVGMDKYGLVEKFPQVQFIKTKEPTPPGTARNIGASASTGDYLIFIDADCIAESSWMETHLQCHQSNSKPIILGGGVTFLSNNYLTLADNVSSFHEYMTHIPKKSIELLPSINLSMAKQIWQKLGGFSSSRTGEDIEFTLRASMDNIEIIFTPDTAVEHAPNRHQFNQILRHSYQFGQNSVKAKREYWYYLDIPLFMKHWISAVLFSPLIAFGIILKIIFIEKLPFKYWHTLPIVYLTKIAWCFGYSNTIKSSQPR